MSSLVSSMYELKMPMLAVMDPDMLKTILVKECFTYFPNRRVKTHKINAAQNKSDRNVERNTQYSPIKASRELAGVCC